MATQQPAKTHTDAEVAEKVKAAEAASATQVKELTAEVERLKVDLEAAQENRETPETTAAEDAGKSYKLTAASYRDRQGRTFRRGDLVPFADEKRAADLMAAGVLSDPDADEPVKGERGGDTVAPE